MLKLHHLCIQTNNYNESLTFYTTILGFKTVKETKNFHNRSFNTWLDLNGLMLELQTNKDDEKSKQYCSQSTGIAHFCFISENLELEFNRIKETGYDNFKIKNGNKIYSVGDGMLFKVIAPEGTIIEFRDKTDI